MPVITFTKRYSDKIAAQITINDSWADQPIGNQRGEAIRQLITNGINLSYSDLSDSDLSGSDLRGSNLRGINLSYSNLRGSNLRDSNLSGSNLSGSNLSGSDLSYSDLSGSDLRGSNLRGVPRITNIHQSVYAAATSSADALNMDSWHSCATTHCRAGWVVTLAGEAGAAMEYCLGTPAAAALIYIASDPSLERIPNFYEEDESAIESMKRLADEEAAKA